MILITFVTFLKWILFSWGAALITVMALAWDVSKDEVTHRLNECLEQVETSSQVDGVCSDVYDFYLKYTQKEDEL